MTFASQHTDINAADLASDTKFWTVVKNSKVRLPGSVTNAWLAHEIERQANAAAHLKAGSDADTEVSALTSIVDNLNAHSIALEAEVTDLEAQVIALQAEIERLTTPAPPPPPPPPPAPVLKFGQPVFRADEIASWTTGASYTALAGSWKGKTTTAINVTAYSNPVSTTQRDSGVKDDSVLAKVQAILWKVDKDPTRLTKVTTVLNAISQIGKGVTDPTKVFADNADGSSPEQDRLVLAWAVTNFCQAAALTGYRNADFDRFLRQVAWPLLTWPLNPNWHGSFADSLMAIAAYLGDEALWEQAKAKTRYYIETSINVGGTGTIKPLLDSTGTPMAGNTKTHWGDNGNIAQITYDSVAKTFKWVKSAWDVPGAYAERTRDLGHVGMGLGALAQALRTWRTVEGSVPADLLDLVKNAWIEQAKRVRKYVEGGKNDAALALLDPGVAKGLGGVSTWQGFYTAKALFDGGLISSDFQWCLSYPDVVNFPPSGSNHLVAEVFTSTRTGA